jgi:YD repeat-containing protein
MRRTIDELGNSTTRVFDDNGNLITETDAQNNLTS